MSMRLMCSVIKEASISINDLLQDLKNSTLVKVLDSEYLPDGVGIKSVINTSFKRLKIPERNAFVSLSVFPEWFGIEEAQAILNVETQVETRQIIRSLERKSLLDCGENFSHFTVHSLLRSFIEEEIKNDEAVKAVFRDSKTQFYDYYISSCKDANENFLRKHYGDAFRSFLDRRSSIISSISNGPQIDRIYTKAVELLSEAKSFLSVVLHDEQLLIEGLYDTAVKEAKRRGKTDDEQRLHSARECHTTAESYFWLSRVQREEGNLKRAQESAKMGSRLRKELLGQHDPHTAVSVNQKGVTENDSEKMAREIRKAETLASQLENPQLPSYYNVQKNPSRRLLELARKQRQEGDLTGALESVRVGVLQRQKLLGSHPCTASSYFEQGNIYFAMGDSKSAVEAFQKTANMSLNLRGYHIITANYYFHLGKAQYKMPDLQGALKSLQRASNMTSHPPKNSTKRAALTYYTLGKVQRHMGDLQGAMDSLQKAIDIRLNLLGGHGHTALAYYKLGLVQRDMGDLKGAMKSVQSAVKIRSKLFGDHRDTALTYYTLGILQRDMGDLKGAMESVQSAAKIRSKLFGDHRDTALTYYTLGILQRDMGNLKEAMAALEKASNMRANAFGHHEDHPITADSFYEQGAIHLDMGDFKAAVQALQKAADINFNLHIDHITANSYHGLRSTQKRKDGQEKTLDSLQRAAHMTCDLLGDHEDTARNFHRLGLVQRYVGNLKEALDSLQRAAQIR